MRASPLAVTLGLFGCVAFATERDGKLPVPVAPSGDAVIRGKAGASEMVITTTRRLAGAIHSLTWAGREFIDSPDHGRQLQSAASFDRGVPGDFWAERFNPTEAGSRADGAGETSTSRLLKLRAGAAALDTTTRMAFWLAPGEKSVGHAALNDRVLSDHTVSKRVRIGYRDLPHAIEYEVTFMVPPGEGHTFAQFESLTGYMPAAFGRFYTFDPRSRDLQPTGDGPGEQNLPLIFTTDDGGHAMGVFSPDQPSAGYETAGYGRFRFAREQVTKWNCVFRVRDPQGVAPGEHRFRTFVVVGTLADVRTTFAALAELFPKRP